jgi:hypothetical protein
MLVIENHLYRNDLRQYVASSVLEFEGLETLILVEEEELPRRNKELIRENMEDHLVKARDRLRSLRNGEPLEWKLPAVKVMDGQALESQLWL